MGLGQPVPAERSPARVLTFGPGEPPTDAAATRRSVTEPGQPPRSSSAAGMWERIEAHLPDYGITRVAHLTGLDRVGIPVHMATKPASRVLSTGSGKGVTEVGSSVSAVMEAIEQTYWEECRPELRVAPERELAAADEPYVSVRALPALRHAVWHDDLPIPWLRLWDVGAAVEVWAPAPAVCGPVDDRRMWLSPVVRGSNGLASGADVVDATLAGALEVVERDAMTISAVRGSVARIDLDATPMSVAGSLAERVEAAGLRLHLADITAPDLGIPSVRALVVDPVAGDGVFAGYGTSFDAEAAAVRAICEAVQSRCLVIAGARDDVFDMHRRSLLRFGRLATDDGAAADRAPRAAAATGSTGSTHGDLAQLVERIEHAGFERVLVYRHSDRRDPAQVVRVVVPGLEGHHGGRSQPGRRAQAMAGAPA